MKRINEIESGLKRSQDNLLKKSGNHKAEDFNRNSSPSGVVAPHKI